jgi:hypothetical protein
MRFSLLIGGLIAGVCAADELRAIDLDAPGALERLQRDDPTHFAKVERILREAPGRSAASVARWLRTEFNAQDGYRSELLKTSYPAQARLSFALDGTQYSKTIYIEAPGKLLPLIR